MSVLVFGDVFAQKSRQIYADARPVVACSHMLPGWAWALVRALGGGLRNMRGVWCSSSALNTLVSATAWCAYCHGQGLPGLG